MLPHEVFVYGTLTDSERVETVLGDLAEYEFRDRATLEGLRRVDGRYPTLVPGGSVEGRILAVDRTGLDRLDRHEGVDRGLYVRVGVPRPNDRRVWTYVGDPKRLGLDPERGWPDRDALRDSVREYVSRSGAVVREHE